MKNIYVALSILLLCVGATAGSAQTSDSDSLRNHLRKEIGYLISDGCELLGNNCKNTFCFLVYRVESGQSVVVDVIAADSTARRTFSQVRFDKLNATIRNYANTVGGGPMNIVQPFSIGCENDSSRVDMMDVQSVFDRLEKTYPGTKMLLPFQAIKFRGRNHPQIPG